MKIATLAFIAGVLLGLVLSLAWRAAQIAEHERTKTVSGIRPE